MGTVPRSHPLALPLFAGLSLALHAAALGTALRPHAAAVLPAPTFEPSPAGLVGETLDVEPASEPVDVDEATAANAAPGDLATPAPHTPATSPGPGPGRTSHPGAPGAASPATAPALFGAVGVRYATDLATTFTRGFPQAASADAIWGGAPFGPAGTAIVTLSIDDGGHLTSSNIGGAPSPALRRGIERTLVLLGARTFTARGAVTKLRVSARVSPNDVHDGLHGDVFALSGGSFAGEVGTAFFALPGSSARRVDVELRLLP
jgi:hypothetical protein